jgi:uncharacterized protein
VIDLLSGLSGALVGLILGLVGGGGSVLAVPLLVYAVGVPSTHVAIGTSAFAVAMSAAFNLVGQWRKGMVKWRCGLVFAAAGVVGALGGATFAKTVDGHQLLALFGGLMVVVGGLMFLHRSAEGDPDVQLTLRSARNLLPWLLFSGLGVGLLSGFFGIGGGFLIVPALMLATGMSLPFAIGTSLIAVTAFGATTAASYTAAGYIDWRIASVFIAGGLAGGLAGSALGRKLAAKKGALATVLAGVIVLVGVYVILRSLGGLA